jgi:hypothetical protein
MNDIPSPLVNGRFPERKHLDTIDADNIIKSHEYDVVAIFGFRLHEATCSPYCKGKHLDWTESNMNQSSAMGVVIAMIEGFDLDLEDINNIFM